MMLKIWTKLLIFGRPNFISSPPLDLSVLKLHKNNYFDNNLFYNNVFGNHTLQNDDKIIFNNLKKRSKLYVLFINLYLMFTINIE